MKNKLFMRVLCLFLMVIVLIPAFPLTARAGFTCWVCDEWIPDGDPYCLNCKCCEDCVEFICGNCGFCSDCARDEDLHCSECEETCFVDLSELDYCQVCGRCEDCCELYSSGGVCKECFEENNDGEGLCPNCEDVVIKGLDDEPLEAAAECENHCEACFEEYVCPVCDECSLCNEVELCEYCGVCENCMVEYEYHCPECGDCYENTCRCDDGGDHCVNCCEDNEYLCDGCGICAEATGMELCPGCHMCEDCRDETHCELCGECYEDVWKCEFGGDHCMDCCVLCEGCDECVLANDLELCDYCGLCLNCCKKEAGKIGPEDVCVMDPQWKEKVQESYHDSSNHFYRYVPTANGHIYACIIPGCDEKSSEMAHRPGDWVVTKKPTTLAKGEQTRFCLDCGAVMETEGLDPIVCIFGRQPNGGFAYNGSDFKLDYSVVTNYGKPATYYRCVFKRAPGEEWKTDLSDAYATFTYDSIPYRAELMNTQYEWILCVYDGYGNYFYSEPFTVTWGDKHKHQYFTVVVPNDVYGEKDGSFTAHQKRCSCGACTDPVAHIPLLVSVTKNCQDKGRSIYLCTVCGEKWTVYGTEYGDHVSNGIYTSVGDKHYTECKYCHARMEDKDHTWETLSSETVCDRTTRKVRCTACGETRTIVERATVPNHEFNNNWIHGNDDKNHWEFCVNCGYKRVEPHHMVGSSDSPYCDYCFYFPKVDGSVELILSEQHGCSHVGTITPRFLSTDNSKLERIKLKLGVTYSWETYLDGKKVVLSTNPTFAIPHEIEKKVACDDSLHITLIVSVDGTPIASADVTIEPLGVVEAVEPTCGLPGNAKYFICTCGKALDKNREPVDPILPPTGNHTFSNDCDPTCNVCGYERIINHSFTAKFNDEAHFVECEICGLVRDYKLHELTATVTEEASCYNTGKYTLSCACGYHTEHESPKAAHKIEKREAKASTCLTQGYSEHYLCIYCGKTFGDASGNEAVALAALKLPLDPNNHEGGKYHYDHDKHWITCACGVDYNEGAHTLDEKGTCMVCHFNAKTLISPIDKNKGDDVSKDSEDGTVSENGEVSEISKDIGEKGISPWIIVLIVLLVLLVAALIVFLFVRSKKKKSEAPAEKTE